jgi:hypothetical protein
VIDVTVDVDGELAIDTVTVSASAPGKSDFHKDEPAAAVVAISIEPSGLAGGTTVLLEARGSKNGDAVIIDRARVALATGSRVAARLHLSADCAGVLSCAADQTCFHGACVAIGPSPVDGGSLDGDANEALPDAPGDSPGADHPQLDGDGSDGDGGGNKADGGGCAQGNDCSTGFCNTVTHQCVAGQCEDGVKNGNETDIDCGGNTCPKCDRNKSCSADGDCKTGSCSRFFCALVSGPPFWLSGPSLNLGRYEHVLAVQPTTDGQANLVAAGGTDELNPGVGSTYEFLDMSQTPLVWAAPADLPNTAAFTDAPGVTDPDGRVLVFSSIATATFTGATGWRTSLAVMPTPRDGSAAAPGADGLVYVLGGSKMSTIGTPTGVVEAYSSANDKWTSGLATMPSPRTLLAAARGSDQRIYAIGGSSQAPNGVVTEVGTVEGYDPVADKWAELSQLPDPVNRVAAVGAPDGRVYAIEGASQAGFPGTVNAYEPSTDRWTPVAPLTTTRLGAGAVIVPDGHIWVVGGLASDLVTALSSVEIYGPVVAATPQSGAPGDTVTITGSNFAKNATVSVYLGSPAGISLGTGTTDGTGALTVSIGFSVPNVAAGGQTLIVVDDRSQFPISVFFRIR